MSPPAPPIPGLTFLEHTADVGVEVHAGSAEELFARAARGMIHLLVADPPSSAAERSVELQGTDLPILLRAWLRAVLRWHEDGFTPSSVSVSSVAQDAQGRWVLSARAAGGPPAADPLREIKGVTLHGLAAERRPRGWYARVIFDV